MGLVMPLLRLIVREHKRERIRGPVLTTNLANWRGGAYGRFTSDKAVFKALAGLEVFALDVSDYEGADYIVDLNSNVPVQLEGKFGLILDLGTLEHIFDVKQALRNINVMLKPGGRVIHSSPGSNWLGHGFYQFSPTLFYDYYGNNGFTNLRCLIGEMPTRDPHYTRKWDFYEWEVSRPCTHLISSRMLAVYFSAEKATATTMNNVPQQGQFFRAGSDSRMGGCGSGSQRWGNRIKSLLPMGVKDVIKRLLKKDLNVKPWGLKYVGRF